MSSELDLSLRAKADKILKTSSLFVGEKYLRSRVKRALDVVVSGPASVATLPVVFLAGAAVVAEDRSFPFVDVGHDYGGLRSKEKYWKIRTMVPNAVSLEEKVACGKAVREVKRSGADPRITKLGRCLRARSLDELPQLWNVFLGDLSMVGPRMLSRNDLKVLSENENNSPYREYIDYMKEEMKLGVTGFYAIFGREKLELTDQMWLDLLYGERASFKADLKIMALTIPVFLSKNSGG